MKYYKTVFLGAMLSAASKLCAQTSCRTYSPVDTDTLVTSVTILNYLKPVVTEYRWIGTAGWAAQPFPGMTLDPATVKKIIPGAVKEKITYQTTGKNSYRIISYEQVDVSQLIPLMIDAIREHQTTIDDLKKQVASLKTLDVRN